jgi:hypothetical protein
MAATAPSRRRAAEIIVTGIGERDATASAFLRAELDGIRYVSFATYDAPALDDAFRDADMLIFAAGPGEHVDEERTKAIAAAAHDRGILVAALLLEELASRGPLELAVVRDAADMVVIVRDRSAIASIVAALR